MGCAWPWPYALVDETPSLTQHDCCWLHCWPECQQSETHSCLGYTLQRKTGIWATTAVVIMVTSVSGTWLCDASYGIQDRLVLCLCYLWTVQCGIWTASKYNYSQVICLIKQTKSASVLVFRGLLIHTSTLIQCNLPFKLQVNSKHVILPSWLVTFPSSWSLRSLACDTTSCRGAKDNYTNNISAVAVRRDWSVR